MTKYRTIFIILLSLILVGCAPSPIQIGLENFRIEGDEWYDRYQGMEELMPYAKAVSAKSHEFDNNGNEVHSDYYQMMEIVFKSNYHGYVGIEYEGNKHSEIDGIRLTRDLLIKVRNS